MAKPSQSRKSGQVVKTAEKAPTRSIAADIRILDVDLVSCSLDRPVTILIDEEKVEHSLGIFLTNYDTMDGKTFALLNVKVQKIMEEQPVLEINASYLLVIENGANASEESIRDYILHAVRTAVWYRFLDLFGLLLLQSDYSFPKLPAEPPPVRILDEKD